MAVSFYTIFQIFNITIQQQVFSLQNVFVWGMLELYPEIKSFETEYLQDMIMYKLPCAWLLVWLSKSAELKCCSDTVHHNVKVKLPVMNIRFGRFGIVLQRRCNRAVHVYQSFYFINKGVRLSHSTECLYLSKRFICYKHSTPITVHNKLLQHRSWPTFSSFWVSSTWLQPHVPVTKQADHGGSAYVEQVSWQSVSLKRPFWKAGYHVVEKYLLHTPFIYSI